MVEKDIATLKAVTESHCAQYSYPLDLASSTALHLRVGDVVCGTTKGEVWRRPFPPRAYANLHEPQRAPARVRLRGSHCTEPRSCERESGEHVDAVLAATGAQRITRRTLTTLSARCYGREPSLGHNSFADVAGWLRSDVDPRVSAKEKPCERLEDRRQPRRAHVLRFELRRIRRQRLRGAAGGQRACCALAITRTCSSSTPAPCRPAADDGLVVCEATQPCMRRRFQ